VLFTQECRKKLTTVCRNKQGRPCETVEEEMDSVRIEIVVR